MSRHLFRGGTWDGRVEDVAPLSHIEVPHVDGDWLSGDVTFARHLYTAQRFVAQADHPCIPQVRVAEQWVIYVHGAEPTPDRVLRQLRLLGAPIERFSWQAQFTRGDVPEWAWGVTS